MTDIVEIPIEREKLLAYHLDRIKLLGLCLYGVGYLVAIVYLAVFGKSFCERQVEALRCWIEDGYIRIKSGVWFRFEKAIPLDKVTDFMIVEGPLMRRHGIKALRIQTAGSNMVEGQILGAQDVDAVRDTLNELRNRTAGYNRSLNPTSQGSVG